MLCSDICTLNESVIYEKKNLFLALIEEIMWVSYVIASGLCIQMQFLD
jgi:hypothetical protein